MARVYESVLIFDPALEGETIDQEIDKVKQVITSRGGRIIEEKRWGLRRLAYEIQKKQQGYYTILLYEGNGDLPAQLEEGLKLNERCLRYLTVVAQEPKGKSTVDDPRKRPARTSE